MGDASRQVFVADCRQLILGRIFPVLKVRVKDAGKRGIFDCG
jgi:hypothetical protein